MSRLGLWGRSNGSLHESMEDFFNQSGFKASTGALELIAMYVCLSLSLSLSLCVRVCVCVLGYMA